MEEETIQEQVQGEAIIIQAKAEARIMHKDRGMINLMSNFIIAKIMDIMLMNVERNEMTWIIDKMQILQKKIKARVMFFEHVM